MANHKFVQELGREHEAFITYDPSQGTYRAWYFHSNGHVWELSGRWTGRIDALSLSAELDQNQSLTRQFHFQNDKNHECTVTWTDENGRVGIYGTLNFTRCDPAATEDSGKNPKTVAKPKSPPPVEMKIFDNEVGKWAFEASMTSGEKTTKVNGSYIVESILGGQFVQTKSTIQGKEGESISIAGFDAATKSYRCWHFDDGAIPSGPAAGTWDEKERTMSWTDQRTAEILIVTKKLWINRDTIKFHAVSSRQNGAVDSTLDGTLTRQKGK